MSKYNSITGASPGMKNVSQMLDRVIQAPEVSVLICGETGTGKEVVARTIHEHSITGDELFVEINCAGIPENLLESELFGHVRGAFTGADRTRRGLIEMAHSGTLLLDEIGDMSMVLQAKLLKVIEDKSFRRLGGEEEIQVDVRIIACTNVDLNRAIEEKRFRQDLYYRLDELRIDLPPLRERGEDVILLAEQFIQEFAQQYDLPPRTLSATAENLLRHYPWPGNVRELRNAIKRTMIMHDALELTPEMIPVSVRSTGSLANLARGTRRLEIDIPEEGISFDEIERRVISHMLQMTDWNRSQAARMLQISYPRLLRKIEKYALHL